MTLHIAFDNSYARLPARFYESQAPEPAPDPSLIALNAPLATELGIDAEALASPEGVALLAGNGLPEGAAGIAMAYAAHQFGNWVPRLGDGRAILWGEVSGQTGRRDIQLKGAGRTPFSRGGDGRAWLGPVLREYLVSEAMHALGVPTTRALAAVRTGGTVMRERALPGAVLTRVAASHIRVGTFQYFAARQDVEALDALSTHVIERHYPQAGDAMGLLHAVVAAQARLIAHWMSLGFIHGVMNTDNMAVSGETIDYGPCAFLDTYVPDKVFSSIDQMGRYAYANQPQIAAWNLAQFASCLLPLIPGDRDAAIEEATAAVNGFIDLYQSEWLRRFGAKIGLDDAGPDDVTLITRLLELMALGGSDFTNSFAALAQGSARDEIADREAYDAWAKDWQARIGPNANAIMQAANPVIIPRNHRIEAVIDASLAGDDAPFHALNRALATPFDAPADPALTHPPVAGEEVTRTFCGT